MINLKLGNCLQEMKKIEDNYIDLVVTSPPYDDLRTYDGYSFDFENIVKELKVLLEKIIKIIYK